MQQCPFYDIPKTSAHPYGKNIVENWLIETYSGDNKHFNISVILDKDDEFDFNVSTIKT